jgi:MscS family membrane protein
MRRITTLFALFMLIAGLAVTASIGYAQSDPTEAIEESTPVPPTDGPQVGRTPGNRPESTPEREPTPTPTSTPLISIPEVESLSASQLFTLEGPITRWVSDLASQYGLDRTFFLGLSLEDWINLGLSILFFFAIYFLGRWLFDRVLRGALKRTKIEKDDELLDLLKPQINWLVLTIALHLSLARLNFLSGGLRVILNQVFFVAYLTILTVILWKLIGFATEALLHRNRSEVDIQRLQPIYMVSKRVVEALLVVVYFSILLSYFGIDITAFAAALGIGGLAISLAAQDTLADAISGFLILLDQPFRVGDRIEIAGLGTWGDVVDIGTRSTRIRTRDNRLVIVPNSAIAKDQIVNYSYPDPRYRVQIEVGIDYNSDLKLAREAAIKAVNKVDGVLRDKPVDALFVDFGESDIIFLIRWWIHSYVDTRRMFDKVNEELLKGFNEAGIKMPNMTYDINLKVDGQEVRQFAEAVNKDRPADEPGTTPGTK